MNRLHSYEWQHLTLPVWLLVGLCSCGATRESTSSDGIAGTSAAAGHAGAPGDAAGTGGVSPSAGASSGDAGASSGGAEASAGARTCLADGPPANDPNAKSVPLAAVRGLSLSPPAAPATCERPPASGAGGAPRLGEDACGCAGFSCPSPQVCVNAIVELGAACGAPTRANQCFDTCTGDADCKSDEICLPAFAANEVPRCFKARCRADSECCSGSCRVLTGYFSQCHDNAVLGIDCR